MPLAGLGSLFGGGGGGLPGFSDSSKSATGPVQAGPVVVNVAGFGGRASGSSDQAGTFPVSGGVEPIAGSGVGLSQQWVTPALILGAFAVAALLLRGR